MIAVVVALTLFIVFEEKGSITIIDKNGQTIIAADNVSQYKENEEAAYLDVVLNEAAESLSKKYSYSIEQAKKKLLKGDYTIYTNFDPDISKNLKEACVTLGTNLDVGAAITNLDGDLLAVASVSQGKVAATNYSLKKSQPCSSFKPLAVYAPAIEHKRINWSTLFIDSPYSKIKGADGTQRDWPANATNTYSYANTTVSKAVISSLNTVAVRCLSEYGVNNSIKFLENNFGINLDYEKSQSAKFGEDEIIGNIALGSTYQGCSTVDMAGYYQIFANGGIYSSPKSITKIVDADGNTIYESSKERKQVISAATSKIVNELLRDVVTSAQGTGRKAYCKNVTVGGKTGTGENNIDNWFVGVTPQYSCAIWHSNGRGNTCPEIFAETISKIPHEQHSFQDATEVTQKIYCLKTGKLAGKNCKTFEIGHYAYGTYIEKCDCEK